MAKIVNRRSLFDGELVDLELLRVEKEGDVVTREVVRHRPGVAIVALQAHTDMVPQGQQVVLVQQYRPPVDEPVLELVAGLVEPSDGTALEAARRELREEVGLEADEWVELGSLLTSPGFTDERLTLFLARDVREVPRTPDAHEALTICKMPFTLAVEEVLAGKVQDAKTVAGLLWAALVLEREQG